MGTVTKLNDVLCGNISKVDDVLKANASKWDDNVFCPQGTPTPTPTQTLTQTLTPTPTPTPTTPCATDCCAIDLVYSSVDCTDACDPVYIPTRHYITKCSGTNCKLSSAIEIYIDNFSGKCEVIASDGYYSDGLSCGYWDSTLLTFTIHGPC